MNIFPKLVLWFCWFVLIVIVVVLLWVLAMFGFSFTTDATADKALWGGYNLDEEYVLDRPIFILKTNKLNGGHLALVPEGFFKGCSRRKYAAPNSIKEYRSNPEQGSIKIYNYSKVKINVVGVLEKGEKLKLHKLDKLTGWSLWAGGATTLKPFAKILSGPYQGKIVDIADVSISYRVSKEDGPYLYKPEQGIIRGVSETMAHNMAMKECS